MDWAWLLPLAVALLGLAASRAAAAPPCRRCARRRAAGYLLLGRRGPCAQAVMASVERAWRTSRGWPESAPLTCDLTVGRKTVAVIDPATRKVTRKISVGTVPI